MTLSPTVKPTPNPYIVLDRKLASVQNRLFQAAHSQPLELKHLGIALNHQGIKGDRLYAHPDMMPLPLRRCSYLQSLSRRQLAILSACLFANFYKLVANSECQTLISNMTAAQKYFLPFSDDYMILHQETSEEMDHIWTFRTIHSMICRETGAKDTFECPGFFRGEAAFFDLDDWEAINDSARLPGDYQHVLSLLREKDGLTRLLAEMKAKGRAWRFRVLNFLIGEASSFLSAQQVQDLGLGGLWLLVRYISNVDLKQVESYLLESPEDVDYEPLAYQINQGHLHDEARHYTTSFDIGLAMYRSAEPSAQAFIRELIRLTMEDYIAGTFLHFPEMLELSNRGRVCLTISLGQNSLAMALNHPEFSDRQVDIDQLYREWAAMEWGKVLPPVGPGLLAQKRWRYIALQFERLRSEMQFEFDSEHLGNLLQRYEGILALESLNEPFVLS
ncbi:hypothetical protein BBFGKLBO_02222 [Synechococcus sp. CBW1107]|uniref:hypothetical protein n=1 Tax=Synechococcus sp. CBW1107 TaxID=2789857 RepID=UPI002AD213D2|nr:hypothetical protein [Synechococcus sp. CBW1107]CAK6697284.1 hypothetical protein BBFGKLBO_02222 [Synechococcus sp. CBW1107]